jgi:hypothetical protein
MIDYTVTVTFSQRHAETLRRAASHYVGTHTGIDALYRAAHEQSCGRQDILTALAYCTQGLGYITESPTPERWIEQEHDLDAAIRLLTEVRRYIERSEG